HASYPTGVRGKPEVASSIRQPEPYATRRASLANPAPSSGPPRWASVRGRWPGRQSSSWPLRATSKIPAALPAITPAARGGSASSRPHRPALTEADWIVTGLPDERFVWTSQIWSGVAEGTKKVACPSTRGGPLRVSRIAATPRLLL